MIGSGGDDETVGYRRPPKYTRFQRGKSGNPRGRPRKKQPEPALLLECPKSAALLKVGAQKLPGKIAGKNQQITYYEAIAQKQAAMAISGNPIAQRDFLNAHRRAEQDQAEYLARKQAEQKRDFDEALEWRLRRVRIWAQAERQGLEPEDPWPHPDDILFDFGTLTWRIRGPIHERQVPYYEMLLAERDLLIMEEVIAWRCRKPVDFCSSEILFYRHLWLAYDQLLPLSWQIPTEHIGGKILWLNLQPLRRIRTMHKECEQYAISMRQHALPWTKESYTKVNQVMRPLLKKFGYRSLAHLQGVYAARLAAGPISRS